MPVTGQSGSPFCQGAHGLARTEESDVMAESCQLEVSPQDVVIDAQSFSLDLSALASFAMFQHPEKNGKWDFGGSVSGSWLFFTYACS